MRRRSSSPAASKPPGWHAQSEMRELQGSTKSPDGIASAPWSAIWRLPRDPFCWKSGAMKNSSKTLTGGGRSRPLRVYVRTPRNFENCHPERRASDFRSEHKSKDPENADYPKCSQRLSHEEPNAYQDGTGRLCLHFTQL